MTASQELAELAERHGLAPEAEGRLGHLLEILADDPVAPTTVADPATAIDAHLVDSLDGLVLDVVRSATRVADLGSGGGFPGLPLAIALPRSTVSLVESVGRKAAFLQRTIGALGLGNAAAIAERAETWRDGMGACDLVTARAVAALPVLVEYAAPLLVPGGALVAWKGRRDRADEADGGAAAAATGLEAAGIHRVAPRSGAEHRHLHVYLKVAPTPDRYPRRPGMARKRPIQAST